MHTQCVAGPFTTSPGMVLTLPTIHVKANEFCCAVTVRDFSCRKFSGGGGIGGGGVGRDMSVLQQKAIYRGIRGHALP